MKEYSLRKFINWLGIIFLFILGVVIFMDFSKRGIWSDELGVNILVVGDDSMGVAVLRPKEGLLSWVDLPDDLMIKISGSSAHYPITSLWRFGVGEKRPYEIVEKSIGESLGVILPRAIKVDGEASIEGFLGRLLTLGAKTDLGWPDRLAIRGYLTEMVMAKKTMELTIPGQAFDPIIEPDGKKFREFSVAITAWTKDKFLYDAILGENVDVVINNLSGVEGKGWLFSGQIETAGMRVVEVKNDKTDSVTGKGCVFYAGDQDDRRSVILLENHFGCKMISKKDAEKAKEKGGGELRIWLL